MSGDFVKLNPSVTLFKNGEYISCSVANGKADGPVGRIFIHVDPTESKLYVQLLARSGEASGVSSTDKLKAALDAAEIAYHAPEKFTASLNRRQENSVIEIAAYDIGQNTVCCDLIDVLEEQGFIDASARYALYALADGVNNFHFQDASGEEYTAFVGTLKRNFTDFNEDIKGRT